jgi:hypothetical protein
MLTYNDDSTPQSPAQGRLAAARDGALKAAKGTLLTERITDLNGIPGRAFTARSVDGLTWDMESYYAGQRLYQILVFASAGKTAAYRDVYMNSFRILPQ